VTFDSGEAVLAEVEADEEQRSATDEQVLRLGDVHVAGAVETSQRHAVQLHVTDVNAICRRRRRTTPSHSQHVISKLHPTNTRCYPVSVDRTTRHFPIYIYDTIQFAKQRRGRLKQQFSTLILLYLRNGARKGHSYYGRLTEKLACALSNGAISNNFERS